VSAELVVLASALARPGNEEELQAALREVAGPTRAQRGCVAFVLLQAADSPANIVAFERWASAADHAAHLEGEHVKRLMQRMSGILVEAPKISTYRVIG
jgi:quinol monooxygenase YgiN